MDGGRRLARRVSARLTAREGRKFGLTVGGVFLSLALVGWWRGRPITVGVLGTVGAALFLAGAAFPTHLGPIQRGWMALAHALSKVTTPIVMGIVYYLVFTPAGVVLRLFGKNALVRPEGDSGFWIARPSAAETSRSMERQF